MIQVVINPDKTTVSPINPLPMPKPGPHFQEEKNLYDDAQLLLPKYPIKETVCKSGIIIDASILAYHAGDKREGVLNEDLSVTLHGPYK